MQSSWRFVRDQSVAGPGSKFKVAAGSGEEAAAVESMLARLPLSDGSMLGRLPLNDCGSMLGRLPLNDGGSMLGRLFLRLLPARKGGIGGTPPTEEDSLRSASPPDLYPSLFPHPASPASRMTRDPR